MATKEYELAADKFTQVTSEPGKPLTYTKYVKGDKVKLDEARAQELIDAGALVDPNATDAGKPGGETKAPTGTDPNAPAYPEGVPSDEWTAKQLAAWSGDNNVDLKGATSKKDTWAAVQAAITPAS